MVAGMTASQERQAREAVKGLRHGQKILNKWIEEGRPGGMRVLKLRANQARRTEAVPNRVSEKAEVKRARVRSSGLNDKRIMPRFTNRRPQIPQTFPLPGLNRERVMKALAAALNPAEYFCAPPQTSGDNVAVFPYRSVREFPVTGSSASGFEGRFTVAVKPVLGSTSDVHDYQVSIWDPTVAWPTGSNGVAIDDPAT